MIETKRLILRNPQLEDAETAFKNWTNSDRVCEFTTWNPHGNINVTKDYISMLMESKGIDYFIIDKSSNECIGSINVVNDSLDHKDAELGYCLGDKYWNQGIMTEAANALIEYLFTHYHYKTVSACHVKDNIKSGLVMIKCGMHYTHTTQRMIKNHVVDLRCYEISFDEWKNIKFHHEVSEFFGVNIPCYHDFEKLLDEFESSGLIIKKAYLFHSVNPLNNNPKIFQYSLMVDNIIEYYIISRKVDAVYLNDMVDNFISDNINSLIDIADYYSVLKLPQILLNYLKEKKLKISFVESCTGGLLASTLISVPTASEVIEESFVTYSNNAKIKYLGIDPFVIDRYSVYSKEVAIEMAKGLYSITNSNVCVSITGLAGGNHPTSNDGSFDYAIKVDVNGKKKIFAYHGIVHGTRNEVRTKQVNQVFFSILQVLEKSF